MGFSRRKPKIPGYVTVKGQSQRCIVVQCRVVAWCAGHHAATWHGTVAQRIRCTYKRSYPVAQWCI